jgi:hypothetical protein
LRRLPDAPDLALSRLLRVQGRAATGPPALKEVVMVQEIGSVLGLQATTRIATSALPCAPVLPVPQRRQHAVTRRLLGVLTGRGRSRA